MSAEYSTHGVDESEREQIWKEARAHFERRALIEQTKGMLMFIYGIDADQAFEVLRRQSQDHNVKLHLIAVQMTKDLLEISKVKGPASRLTFDSFALTAHHRISHVAARQLDGQNKTGE